jgi:low affinity Fe/Cu permease
MNQQHALQLRLEEAMVRISASESEVMALASKKEAKATSKLQAAEKAAAKAVALLDKKEEEVQQLQQVIADSETSIFAVLALSRRDILNSLFLTLCVAAFLY